MDIFRVEIVSWNDDVIETSLFDNLTSAQESFDGMINDFKENGVPECYEDGRMELFKLTSNDGIFEASEWLDNYKIVSQNTKTNSI